MIRQKGEPRWGQGILFVSSIYTLGPTCLMPHLEIGKTLATNYLFGVKQLKLGRICPRFFDLLYELYGTLKLCVMITGYVSHEVNWVIVTKQSFAYSYFRHIALRISTNSSCSNFAMLLMCSSGIGIRSPSSLLTFLQLSDG